MRVKGYILEFAFIKHALSPNKPILPNSFSRIEYIFLCSGCFTLFDKISTYINYKDFDIILFSLLTKPEGSSILIPSSINA